MKPELAPEHAPERDESVWMLLMHDVADEAALDDE